MPKQKAIMVQTRDDRYLLCPLDAQVSVISMAQHIKAKVFRVTTTETVPTLLDIAVATKNLKGLPKTPPEVENLVPVYLPTPPKERTNTMVNKNNYQVLYDQAVMIREYLVEELKRGRSVDLTKLQAWIDQKGITLSKGGLSRHLQKSVDYMVQRGWTKVKEGRSYRVFKP